MAHVARRGVYRFGVCVVIGDGRQALWDVNGAAALDAQVLRDNVLVGFVSHNPGLERFDVAEPVRRRPRTRNEQMHVVQLTPKGSDVEASETMSFGDQDGGTFIGFADPDGDTWAVQELKVGGEKPLILGEARGRFGA